MSEKQKRAVELFDEGFNCAQSVIAVFANDLPGDTSTALRMAGGFGHGLRSGEVCGAISGAVMVLGLREGSDEPSDQVAKAACNAQTLELMRTLTARLGACECRKLIVDEKLKARGSLTCPGCTRRSCAAVIEAAVEALEERGF